MLTTRLLPPEEWDKLDDIEPYKSKGLPGDPSEWRIVVVERGGAVVGTCAFFTAVHWDNWWIAPESRGKGSVLLELLRASDKLLEGSGIETVYCGAEQGNDAASDLLVHFGFLPTIGKLFVLDVTAALLRRKEA